MVQEIIVYIILVITALHLLYQTYIFFKPSKGQRNGLGCSAGGSCSNCSLKIDFDAIQLNPEKPKQAKKNFADIKQWN